MVDQPGDGGCWVRQWSWPQRLTAAERRVQAALDQFLGTCGPEELVRPDLDVLAAIAAPITPTPVPVSSSSPVPVVGAGAAPSSVG